MASAFMALARVAAPAVGQFIAQKAAPAVGNFIKSELVPQATQAAKEAASQTVTDVIDNAREGITGAINTTVNQGINGLGQQQFIATQQGAINKSGRSLTADDLKRIGFSDTDASSILNI